MAEYAEQPPYKRIHLYGLRCFNKIRFEWLEGNKATENTEEPIIFIVYVGENMRSLRQAQKFEQYKTGGEKAYQRRITARFYTGLYIFSSRFYSNYSVLRRVNVREIPRPARTEITPATQ